MNVYWMAVGGGAATTAVLSFWFVTREIRRGRIRRAPRLSIARACTEIIRRGGQR